MGSDDAAGTEAPREGPFVPAPATGGPSAAPVLGATTTPWVLDLIRRFRAAGSSARVCVHLAEDPDEPATWAASIPDLRSCRRAACLAAASATLQERLGHPPDEEPPRCTTCGRVGIAVRGVGVAVGPTMLRGTVCDDCLAAKPVATPPSATAPIAAGSPAEAVVEIDDEPLAADPQALAAAEDRVPFDATGRRALRRGWLMAEACCKATARGLDEDRAVVGGLMVRAAKLARGLAGGAAADSALAEDLAFRSLVETTTLLWWLLRAEPGVTTVALAAFREDGAPGRGADDLRGGPHGLGPDAPLSERLADLGRESDLVALLGPGPVADAGSWRELTAAHLDEGPDGFALDLSHRAIGPLQALVAGEHLSLAAADYVERMPTDLDPGHVRPLAEEVTELRAATEAAFADAAARGRFAG